MMRILLIFILFSTVSCSSDSKKQESAIPAYKPIDQKLFDEILAMDQVFFNAYNNCDMETQASIYSDSIEFFHDKGGLMTSKKELLTATEKNICGKVTRERLEESMEVYPIHNYGVVQIGYHRFYNSEEPDAESIPSKFIAMWHKEKGNWKMTKIVSLH